MDYRALNRMTVKNGYPFPRTDDMFDHLNGTRYLLRLIYAPNTIRLDSAMSQFP